MPLPSSKVGQFYPFGLMIHLAKCISTELIAQLINELIVHRDILSNTAMRIKSVPNFN